MTLRLYHIGEWLAARVPTAAGYAVAWAVGQLLFRTAPSLRKTLLAHQRQIAPHATASEVARRARGVCVTVAKNYYDLFRLPHLAADDLTRHFALVGGEHLAAARAAGRGTIIVAPHLGNFNFVAPFAATLNPHTLAVVEQLHDPAQHAYFLHLRRALHLEIVENGPQAARAVIRTLRQNGIVLMLADRDVGGVTDGVTFFGARTRLPAGPGTIARRTGAALLPSYSLRITNGRSLAVVLPPLTLPDVWGGADAQRAADTQAITRCMAFAIAQAPDQWAALQPVWRAGGAAEDAKNDGPHPLDEGRGAL